MGKRKLLLSRYLYYQPAHTLFTYTLFCAYFLCSPVSSHSKCVAKGIWFHSILRLADGISSVTAEEILVFALVSYFEFGVKIGTCFIMC